MSVLVRPSIVADITVESGSDEFTPYSDADPSASACRNVSDCDSSRWGCPRAVAAPVRGAARRPLKTRARGLAVLAGGISACLRRSLSRLSPGPFRDDRLHASSSCECRRCHLERRDDHPRRSVVCLAGALSRLRRQGRPVDVRAPPSALHGRMCPEIVESGPLNGSLPSTRGPRRSRPIQLSPGAEERGPPSRASSLRNGVLAGTPWTQCVLRTRCDSLPDFNAHAFPSECLHHERTPAGARIVARCRAITRYHGCRFLAPCPSSTSSHADPFRS